MLVAGPVVVLDMDSATFTTLCGKAAIDAAHDWGAKLADPRRTVPICIDGTSSNGNAVLVCTQVDAAGIVGVVLAPSDDPRLTGALFGQGVHNYKLVRDLNDRIANASCP